MQFDLSQENKNDFSHIDAQTTTPDRVITFVRIGISLIVLIAALYVQTSLFRPILGPEKWTSYREIQRFIQHVKA